MTTPGSCVACQIEEEVTSKLGREFYSSTNLHTCGIRWPSGKKPVVIKDAHGKPAYWDIRLNKYQRDNLISLIRIIGYPFGNGVEPFTYVNSGDWVGELY